MKIGFWLRWSLRDLRQRWMQVVAIALIIALGTGVFCGLGSQRDWREESLDKSYAQLKMFDVRMMLTDSSYTEQAKLETALRSIEGVSTVETRLIQPTLVDVSNDGDTIMVPGRLIGMNIADGEPDVNQLFVHEGRNFSAQDAGKNVAVVDYLFAKFYELSPGNRLEISGEMPLEFIGIGQIPEYFQIIETGSGIIMGEQNFAIVYVPLDSLQNLSGRQGLVNDAVILLEKGASRDAVRAQIESVMTAQFPETGYSLVNKEEDTVHNIMYADAKNDEQFWNGLAFLFLFGAALATFNLAGRIVESQRRQIGIGMALGVQPVWLAVRPLMLGLEIAALGTIFGLGFGYVFSRLFASLFEEFLPLPYWEAPFYVGPYLRATALGIVIPFVATLYPVWRAVRVKPIDAIQTGYLVAKGGGLAPMVKTLPLPGKSFTQMPFRNVLRSPWRTLLTLIGISIAILMLVGLAGMLDTFLATIEQAEDSLLQSHEDRMVVMMDNFYPVEPVQTNSPLAELVDTERIAHLKQLTTAEGSPLFAQVDTGIVLGAEFKDGDDDFEVMLELMDMGNAQWTPTLVEGSLPVGRPGIVIAEKAAKDFDVSVGETITVSHPKREGLFSFQMVETEMQITGIHDNPLRTIAYVDLSQAETMGLDGLTNYLTVYPAARVNQDTVRRTIFGEPGIASVQAMSDISKGVESVIEIFTTILVTIQGVVVVLAFLIAFNSTSINVDERQREIATMFAFGLPVRVVARMQMLENFITGLLGTLLGVVLGYLVVRGFMGTIVENMMPEIQFAIVISSGTLLAAAVIGILVVALTPLLSIRKMLRMNIPSTLRVME